jgi:glycosyltransferase involved in cell wall biosynthesis
MNLSVIVTSFNHGIYVEKCLNSILENRIPATELIICDDASTDNSADLISKWVIKNYREFQNIYFYSNQKNIGTSATVNQLISQCNGNIICGIASDDLVAPDGLSAKVDYLMRNNNLAGAFSDGSAIDLQENLYSESLLLSSGIDKESLDSKNIRNTALTNWTEPMNLQFWRRSAFKVHGGEFEFTSDVGCEDLQFALWAISRNAFGFLDRKCVAYRCRSWPQTAPNTSKATLRKRLLDMAIIYGRSAELFENPIKRYLVKKAEYHLAVVCENYGYATALDKTLKKGINQNLPDIISSAILRY